jgi:hypothetical protein
MESRKSALFAFNLTLGTTAGAVRNERGEGVYDASSQTWIGEAHADAPPVSACRFTSLASCALSCCRTTLNRCRLICLVAAGGICRPGKCEACVQFCVTQTGCCRPAQGRFCCR